MQERDYTRHINENDGLQVQLHAAPEPLARDNELLQVWDDPNTMKEVSRTYNREESDSGSSSVQKPGRKRRPWLRYILVLLSSTLLILVIILAGYFGYKATHHSSPSGDTSVAIATPPMERSASGAWNGTGIAAFTSGIPQFWGSVVYQDYTGTLKENRWTFINDSVSTLNARSISVNASNATALWASTYSFDYKMYYYHLIYVNQFGILTDLWRNSSDIDAHWNPGNLSALSFRCPIGSRAAIGGEIDGHVPHTSTGQNATRLWVGGVDGALHQLTMNWTSWTWSQDNYTLPQSYAYGAAAGAYGFGKDGTPNTTVYSTLPGGQVQLHFSIDGDPHDSRSAWPHGNWLDPASSALTISANSSIFASWNTSCQIARCDSYLLYPGVDGKLARSVLDSARDDVGQVASQATEFSSYRIMPGSDLKGAQGLNNQILFHQVNGSDIAWFVISDDGSGFNHGTLELSMQ